MYHKLGSEFGPLLVAGLSGLVVGHSRVTSQLGLAGTRSGAKKRPQLRGTFFAEEVRDSESDFVVVRVALRPHLGL